MSQFFPKATVQPGIVYSVQFFPIHALSPISTLPLPYTRNPSLILAVFAMRTPANRKINLRYAKHDDGSKSDSLLAKNLFKEIGIQTQYPICDIVSTNDVEVFMKKRCTEKFMLSAVLCFFAAGLSFAQSDWFMAQTRKADAKSVLATSELVEAQFAGKYLYPPINVLDGDFATVWCEAEKDGPGIGESITIEFAEPVSFDEIQIVNGFAYKDYYTKNNRVKSILLTQTAGKHFQQREYVLADGVQNWQSIRFGLPQTAQTLTIKITGVYKGAKYDDTCIGDIRLLYKGKVIPFENVAPLKAAQEENSKLMLKNKAGDFEKEFLALFGDGDYLYLRNERGGGFIITKDGSRISDMDNCVILEAQSNEAIIRYYKEKYGDYGADTVQEQLEKHNRKDYDYVIISRSRVWEAGPRYKLGNYRILKYETIQYVETVTATLIKLDGKTVYVNGVKYTVLNPNRVIDVSFDAGP